MCSSARHESLMTRAFSPQAGTRKALLSRAAARRAATAVARVSVATARPARSAPPALLAGARGALLSARGRVARSARPWPAALGGRAVARLSSRLPFLRFARLRRLAAPATARARSLGAFCPSLTADPIAGARGAALSAA